MAWHKCILYQLMGSWVNKDLERVHSEEITDDIHHNNRVDNEVQMVATRRIHKENTDDEGVLNNGVENVHNEIFEKTKK